jgi:hypothetical protein
LALIAVAAGAGLVSARPTTAAPAGTAVKTGDGPQAKPRPLGVGVMADVGLPDGVMASLVLQPLRVLRVAAGVGTNGSAPGLRGGLTLLPFGRGPSFTVEAGYLAQGDLNRLAAYVGRSVNSELLRRVSYWYGNAHVGLDLGGERFVVFAHGGLSYLRANLGDSGAYIARTMNERLAQSGSGTRASVAADAVVSGLALSGKLGVLVYLP